MQTSSTIEQRRDVVGLSAREYEVLSWVCRGKTNPEIAGSSGSRPARCESTSRTPTRSSVSARARVPSRAFSAGSIRNRSTVRARQEMRRMSNKHGDRRRPVLAPSD